MAAEIFDAEGMEPITTPHLQVVGEPQTPGLEVVPEPTFDELLRGDTPYVPRQPRNWASTRLGAAAGTAAILVEAAPIPLNEGLRTAAGVFGYHVSGGNSLASAAAAGAAAVVIEGAAGIAAADLLATERGARATDYVQNVLRKLGIEGKFKSNAATDAAVGFLGGSAVLTTLKHQLESTRSRADNRRTALRSTAAIAALTAVETYAVAKGFERPSPATIAAGAIAVGAFFGAGKWAKERLSSQEAPVVQEFAIEGVTPHRMTPSEAELEAAQADPRTISIETEAGVTPVLAPVDTAHWYNTEFLSKRFGTEDIYYFTNPNIQDPEQRAEMHRQISDLIATGAVVLFGEEQVGNVIYGNLSAELEAAGIAHDKVSASSPEHHSFLPQYEGHMSVRGDKNKELGYRPTRPIMDVYRDAIEQGKINFDPENGPALDDIITGDEADRLWNIYKKPFEKLSRRHPISVGYSEEDFRAMLADPNTLKAVYRKDGKISTMTFLVDNLDDCDWLDKTYYTNKYPDAVANNKLMVIPGIVTDEGMRGERLSVPLLSLVAKAGALTESPFVIAFECTEISAKYIPRIAKIAINSSRRGKTKGFSEVSRLTHYAITRQEQAS